METTIDMDKFIIIKSEKTITIEEENEIADLVKQVLTRNNENRKVFIINDINLQGREL